MASSTSATASVPVAVKIYAADGRIIRRTSFDSETVRTTLTLDAFLERIRLLFANDFLKQQLYHAKTKLLWVDEDDDYVSLSSNEELAEAFRVLAATNGNNNKALVISLKLPKLVVHPAVCDGCEEPILDVRNKCKECNDYDLCSLCYKERSGIHPKHEFDSFANPFAAYFRGCTNPNNANVNANRSSCCSTSASTSSNSNSNSCPRSAPRCPSRFGPCGFFGNQIVWCDGCDERISGLRFKCNSCPDYDLCEVCIKKQDRIHPGHSFAQLWTNEWQRATPSCSAGACPVSPRCSSSSSAPCSSTKQADSPRAEPKAASTPASPKQEVKAADVPAKEPVDSKAATPSSSPKEIKIHFVHPKEPADIPAATTPASVANNSPVEAPVSAVVVPPAPANVTATNEAPKTLSEFEIKLKQLADMGFTNNDANVFALVQNRGDVVRAIQQLLSH